MERDNEPLLQLDPTDPDDVDFVASNDEWAFEQAERLFKKLPQRVGKDQRTEGEVFDRQTLMTLHKLLISRAIKSLDFPISTGKEANVFRGTTPQGGHVAVKIYRVNTATFKHVLKYIEGDERFEGIRGDKREMVSAWAQKEFRNLDRMHTAGVDVPEPIRVMANVLITEYIGVPEGPWPTLKELGRVENPMPLWEKLRDDYIRIVREAGLVHADFSEYNILVERPDDMEVRNPRIIDVGQAVLRSHPMSREFMERDVLNITNYFRRLRLKVHPEEILAEVRA